MSHPTVSRMPAAKPSGQSPTEEVDGHIGPRDRESAQKGRASNAKAVSGWLGEAPRGRERSRAEEETPRTRNASETSRSRPR